MRDKTTKLKQFNGGLAKFKAKLAGGTWADDWADEGVNSTVAAKNSPMSMTVQIRLNGQIYESVVSMLFTSKPGTGASVKQAK